MHYTYVKAIKFCKYLLANFIITKTIQKCEISITKDSWEKYRLSSFAARKLPLNDVRFSFHSGFTILKLIHIVIFFPSSLVPLYNPVLGYKCLGNYNLN